MGIIEGTHHTHKAEIVKIKITTYSNYYMFKTKEPAIAGKWLKVLWKQKPT